MLRNYFENFILMLSDKCSNCCYFSIPEKRACSSSRYSYCLLFHVYLKRIKENMELERTFPCQTGLWFLFLSCTCTINPENRQRLNKFFTLTEAIQQSSIKGFGLESGQAMLDVAIADGSEKLNINEGKLTSSSSRWRQMQTFAPYTSPQYSSASYSSDYRKSSDDNPLPLQPSEAQPRRSRPSFLDSLNVPRAPSLALPNQYAESREPISGNDTEIPMDSLSQSAFGTRYTDNLATSTTAVSNGKHLPDGSEHSVEKKPEFYLHKKDEDFAALEQVLKVSNYIVFQVDIFGRNCLNWRVVLQNFDIFCGHKSRTLWPLLYLVSAKWSFCFSRFLKICQPFEVISIFWTSEICFLLASITGRC